MSTDQSSEWARPAKQSTDRAFGLVFSVVFVLIGLWPLWESDPPRWWSLGLATAFLVTSLAAPRLLAPLNRAWMRLGRLLQRVVHPVVMAMLFFGVVTPMGVIRRAVVRNPLNLKSDPEAESYWIARDPPGPAPEAMTQQF